MPNFDDIEDITGSSHPIIKPINRIAAVLHITNFEDRNDFIKQFNILQRRHKFFCKKSEVLIEYKKYCKDNNLIQREDLTNFLLKRRIRSSSGVIVNTVFTAPNPKYTDPNGKEITQRFSCSENCSFCPAEPGQPRSYVKDGPSTKRANENDFDPVKQFRNRLFSLKECGHVIDKIEVIVLGGTWSCYPMEYRDWFCKMLFYSANTLDIEYEDLRDPFTLEDEQRINESSRYHIIGLTIETRPDYINLEEIISYRRQGVTRVQIGIQHTDDEVLDANNRNCNQQDIINGLRLLKDSNYKVDIHIMLDLYKSSPEKDREMIKTILTNSDYFAHQIKLYPMYIAKWTLIKQLYERGEFIPQAKQDIINNIIYFLQNCQIWWRINRIGRDIPSKNKEGTQYLYGEVKDLDLRAKVDKIMEENYAKDPKYRMCKDIRAREPGWDNEHKKDDVMIFDTKYKANGATEYFISIESQDREIIFGFLRLRLTTTTTLKALKGCALIQELHVYGPVKEVFAESNYKSSQHYGFGKKLMRYAEYISFINGYNKISVISGVGVRNYYRKLGYELKDTFMVKTLVDIQMISIILFIFIAIVYNFFV